MAWRIEPTFKRMGFRASMCKKYLQALNQKIQKINHPMQCVFKWNKFQEIVERLPSSDTLVFVLCFLKLL